MINEWASIAEKIGAYGNLECFHHPHVLTERAELFHCSDGCSTEFEFLNLLNALVLATKPIHALETGTFDGFATLAIASAIKSNGVGNLSTVDMGECLKAKGLFKEFGLDGQINFVCEDALEYIRNYEGPTFDFVFIDSGATRVKECKALLKGKVKNGALIVFHDASPYRNGPSTNQEQVDYLKGFDSSFKIWLSRGLEMIQLKA